MNDTYNPGTGGNQPPVPGISVKVYPQQNKGNLMAFASVNLGGVFAINDLRVMNSEKGTFVAMSSSQAAYRSLPPCGESSLIPLLLLSPQNLAILRGPLEKDARGEYRDICFPTTADMRKALTDAVLGEYDRAMQKTSVRGELNSARREAAARPPAPFAERPRMPQAAQ